MYKIEVTNRFKQSFKKARKNGYNLEILEEVIDMLATGKKLPAKFKNHPLKGNFNGYYDCHVLPDWVLIYKIEKEKLKLLLFDIDTHSNLFK